MKSLFTLLRPVCGSPVAILPAYERRPYFPAYTVNLNVREGPEKGVGIRERIYFIL